MRLIKFFGVIAVAVVIIVIVSNWSSPTKQEIEKIMGDVRPFIESCKAMPHSEKIMIKGKALVWDLKSNSKSDAHAELPSDLRIGEKEKQVTVFIVTPEQNMLVGHYSISRQPGYRRYVDVYVIYWPEKKAAGLHSVVGFDPRHRRPVQHSPEYGDYTKAVAAWIAGLPKQ